MITRTLAPALLALLALFAVACFTESSPQIVEVVVTATPESDPSPTTAATQSSLLAPTPTASIATVAPSNTPTPKPTTALEPSATPLTTPTPMVRPTPTRPQTSDNDICYRSPEVQRQILQYLKVSLCQAVTEAELFRIDDEMGIEAREIGPGDFQGLVNLRNLEVEVPARIPAGTFRGLDNLETLHVNLHNMEPGTLEGLSGLKRLVINIKSERELSEEELENPRLASDLLEGLLSLEALAISEYGSRTLDSQLLQNLPTLESFSISFLLPETDTDTRFSIPAGLFGDNPLLKYIGIGKEYYWDDSARFTVPRNVFAHLEHLQELRLPCCSASEDGNDHKVVINSKSPLFQAALNDGRHPDGLDTGSSYVKILPPE